MSAIVKVTGLASVYMINSSDATISDVREWLDQVEKLGFPPDTRLDSATLKVTLRSENIEVTRCDEHSSESAHYGVVMFDGNCKKDKEMPTNP